jgi:hypothetical protein
MIGYEQTGVRNIIQGVLLGHLLHTISYTIPPLPTGPPQKRKLPDGQFCTGKPGSPFTVSEAGVLVRKLRQLLPLSAKLSGLTPGVSY